LKKPSKGQEKKLEKQPGENLSFAHTVEKKILLALTSVTSAAKS